MKAVQIARVTTSLTRRSSGGIIWVKISMVILAPCACAWASPRNTTTARSEPEISTNPRTGTRMVLVMTTSTKPISASTRSRTAPARKAHCVS